MKIVHLTDTHILGDDSKLFGIDPSDMLEKALKSINTHHKDAQFISITGDLSHNGNYNSYVQLNDILKQTNIPINLILGNHDKKIDFNKVFDICKNDKFVQYEVVIKNDVFLFLHTVVDNEEYGTLCQERLEYLQNKLEQYKNNNVYIFMHHFPLKSYLKWMDENASFMNKKDFWEIVSKYKNVKHIFTGHLHKIIHSNYKNIPVTCTKSTNFQLAYVPSTSDDYINTNEQPSYNVIEITNDSLLIHNCEFLLEDKIMQPDGY